MQASLADDSKSGQVSPRFRDSKEIWNWLWVTNSRGRARFVSAQICSIRLCRAEMEMRSYLILWRGPASLGSGRTRSENDNGGHSLLWGAFYTYVGTYWVSLCLDMTILSFGDVCIWRLSSKCHCCHLVRGSRMLPQGGQWPWDQGPWCRPLSVPTGRGGLKQAQVSVFREL